MLRRYLELSADMILHTVPGKRCLIFIRHQIIKPDTGTDKYLLHLRKLPAVYATAPCNPDDLHSDSDTVVGNRHCLFWTDTLRHLLVTCRVAKIGGRSANIMDVALEIRVLRHQFRLLSQDRFMASRLHDPPLMASSAHRNYIRQSSPGC